MSHLTGNRELGHHADPSTPGGKSLLFLRLLKRHKNRLQPGKRCWLKGSNLRGAVERLEYNENRIEWEYGYPKFVEVKLDDGTITFVNPKLVQTMSKRKHR